MHTAITSNTIAVVYNTGSLASNVHIKIDGVTQTANVVSVRVLGAVSANGNVVLKSTGSNIVINQDSLAWLDYNFISQGLQFQDSGSLPARAFLGAGAATSSLDLSTYYSTEEPESLNTILITENNQTLIQE